MSVRITVGCDPELFLKKRSTGEFVSAHDLLPGTKLEPFQVTAGAIQVDGVAAEFNIQPAQTVSHFTTYIASVMSQLQDRLGSDYELSIQPTVEFPEEYFKNLPEETRELGCNPDFNAWTGQVNEKPDGGSTTMRTAAGHIHIGWLSRDCDPTDPVHFEDCCIIAKNLDYWLGIQSLKWDPDTKRRSLYGKAGSFRPKPYGMEYRPLSNMWLSTTKLQQWVYQASYNCVNGLINGGARFDEDYGDLAREVINESQSWWNPADIKTNKHFKKLQGISRLTGMSEPPSIPKKTPAEVKEVSKPSPKHIYSSKKVSIDSSTVT